MKFQPFQREKITSIFLIFLCAIISGCSFEYLASAQIGNARDKNIRLQATGYPQEENNKTELIFYDIFIFVSKEHPFMLRMPDGVELVPHEMNEAQLRQRYPDLEKVNPSRDALSYRSKKDRWTLITFGFNEQRKISSVSIRVCRIPLNKILGDSSGNNWFDVPISLEQLIHLFGKPDYAGTILTGGPAGEIDCLPEKRYRPVMKY